MFFIPKNISFFSLITPILLLAFIVNCGCEVKNNIKKTSDDTKKNLEKIRQHAQVDPLVLKKFEQIRTAYITYYEKHGRGPSNWQELRQGASIANVGSTWIQEAKREGYTVVWNLKINELLKLEENDFLLAYDREAPTRGGWVLLTNNTMERMSKSDFEYFRDLEIPDSK